jgi:hypothetical protein
VWTYRQKSGELLDATGTVRFVGYAGAEPNGKNNPALQNVPDIGPLPCGIYSIDPPVQGTELGPWALPLQPNPDTIMYGRAGFYIHDDSLVHPGAASCGCIVTIGEESREAIWQSGDHSLLVVSGS